MLSEGSTPSNCQQLETALVELQSAIETCKVDAPEECSEEAVVEEIQDASKKDFFKEEAAKEHKGLTETNGRVEKQNADLRFVVAQQARRVATPIPGPVAAAHARRFTPERAPPQTQRIKALEEHNAELRERLGERSPIRGAQARGSGSPEPAAPPPGARPAPAARPFPETMSGRY